MHHRERDHDLCTKIKNELSRVKCQYNSRLFDIIGFIQYICSTWTITNGHTDKFPPANGASSTCCLGITDNSSFAYAAAVAAAYPCQTSFLLASA